MPPLNGGRSSRASLHFALACPYISYRFFGTLRIANEREGVFLRCATKALRDYEPPSAGPFESSFLSKRKTASIAGGCFCVLAEREVDEPYGYRSLFQYLISL